MIIESIELQNYRNIEKLKLPLGEKNNILYGDNAQSFGGHFLWQHRKVLSLL